MTDERDRRAIYHNVGGIVPAHRVQRDTDYTIRINCHPMELADYSAFDNFTAIIMTAMRANVVWPLEFATIFASSRAHDF